MSDRSRGGGWAISIVAAAVLAFLAVGFVGRSWRAFDAPMVSIERFLEFKKNSLVREVWMKGDTLLVQMHPGFMLEGRETPKLRVRIPGGFLQEASGEKRLRDGLDPDRFHWSQDRRGCGP